MFTQPRVVIILPDETGTNQKNFPNSVWAKQPSVNMSFVDTLRQWDDAVTCADRQDWSEALRVFLSIQEPNSKIYFNIGCLQLLDQDWDAAEKVNKNCSLCVKEEVPPYCFCRFSGVWRQHTQGRTSGRRLLSEGNHLLQKEKVKNNRVDSSCGLWCAKITDSVWVGRFEESSSDFQRAFKALRGNQLIDYKALGLRYILYACEVRASTWNLHFH